MTLQNVKFLLECSTHISPMISLDFVGIQDLEEDIQQPAGLYLTWMNAHSFFLESLYKCNRRNWYYINVLMQEEL